MWSQLTAPCLLLGPIRSKRLSREGFPALLAATRPFANLEPARTETTLQTVGNLTDHGSASSGWVGMAVMCCVRDEFGSQMRGTMIGAMAIRPGIHTVGPDSGALRVNTYREGMAQKVGHDLIIEVGQWRASIEVEEGGSPKAIALEADPRSLRVREGQHGVKPLTDKDRTEIRSNIDEKVLRDSRLRSARAPLSSPMAG